MRPTFEIRFLRLCASCSIAGRGHPELVDALSWWWFVDSMDSGWGTCIKKEPLPWLGAIATRTIV